MFIAHVPASYLLAKGVFRKPFSLANLVIISIGAVFPDIDLLRFYLLDNHQFHHHSYWTHRPAVWFCLFFLIVGAVKILKPKYTFIALLFFIGAVLHMALDTIVGEIAWLWPLTDQTWTPVHIQDTQEIWILNFFLHWTFAVEVFICITALIVFIKYDALGVWHNAIRFFVSRRSS